MPYRLYVFGSNGEGQLGVPAADILNIPTVVQSWPSGVGIESVHGGDNHTLILSFTGDVYSAGDNQKGQLNMKGLIGRREGFALSQSNISLCTAACQSSAYILKEITDTPQTSTLVTQGSALWGELGLGSINNTTSGSEEDSEQTISHPVIDLAAGAWHYVIILADGEVWGWGKSRLGQLGAALASDRQVPVPTPISEHIPFRPVKAVCGKEFTYLVSDPAIGAHIILGQDKFSLQSSKPESVRGWKQIGATWNAIFVLFEDGRLAAWGKDNMWKLTPDNLPRISRMAVGSEHVLALTMNGKLISWGWGKHGNCGDLTELSDTLKFDMVSGIWNEIPIPGEIQFVGAGYCTSFVLTEVEE